MQPVLSSGSERLPWAFKMNVPSVPLVDYEPGGLVLGEAGGLRDVLWRGECRGKSIYLSHDGAAEESEFVVLPVAPSSISLSFDGTNRPHIAYVTSGTGKWLHWDSTANAYATMDLGDTLSARTASDIYDRQAQDLRDTWVAYVRGGVLYTRIQRDRYTIEYDVSGGQPAGNKLLQLGRNTGFRMQWRTV